MVGGEGRGQHAGFHPHIILQHADFTEALGADGAAGIALDAAGELFLPKFGPLAQRELFVLGHQFIGDALHFLADIDLGGVGPGTAAMVPLFVGAGQADDSDAFQIHLVTLGHFDQPPLLAAAGDHTQTDLSIGLQQHVHRLRNGVFGP